MVTKLGASPPLKGGSPQVTIVSEPVYITKSKEPLETGHVCLQSAPAWTAPTSAPWCPNISIWQRASSVSLSPGGRASWSCLSWVFFKDTCNRGSSGDFVPLIPSAPCYRLPTTRGFPHVWGGKWRVYSLDFPLKHLPTYHTCFGGKLSQMGQYCLFKITNWRLQFQFVWDYQLVPL